MVVVPARVLNCPRLRYGGSTYTPREGVWNLSAKKFLNSSTMLPWTYLRIGSAVKADPEKLKRSLNAMTSVFVKQGLKGMVAKDYTGPTVDWPATADRVPTKLRSSVDKSLGNVFKDEKKKGISMFLVILPSDDPWLYNRVKFWGDVGCGTNL